MATVILAIVGVIAMLTWLVYAMTGLVYAVGRLYRARRWTRREIRRTRVSESVEGWGVPGDPRNDVDELEFSPGAVERALHGGAESASANREEPARIQRGDDARDRVR